ncbi:hypothetical protein [Hoeflea ulvae]|uniref:DUF2188 domain-containing protein n=1 Tax=Hoeflea ulvae TaxID=2983764 RepID=A0ABT3YMY1_9HYPH|nr:hypothetical protein [Hoeflea ulvae]MCY0096932.1 hypothetical protein [Hoeflea ulvae]
MEKLFCDFVPDCDGWSVLIDGRWIATYRSLHLAREAARTMFGFPGNALTMRQMAVDGKLYELRAALASPEPENTIRAQPCRN